MLVSKKKYEKLEAELNQLKLMYEHAERWRKIYKGKYRDNLNDCVTLLEEKDELLEDFSIALLGDAEY